MVVRACARDVAARFGYPRGGIGMRCPRCLKHPIHRITTHIGYAELAYIHPNGDYIVYEKQYGDDNEPGEPFECNAALGCGARWETWEDLRAELVGTEG